MRNDLALIMRGIESRWVRAYLSGEYWKAHRLNHYIWEFMGRV